MSDRPGMSVVVGRAPSDCQVSVCVCVCVCDHQAENRAQTETRNVNVMDCACYRAGLSLQHGSRVPEVSQQSQWLIGGKCGLEDGLKGNAGNIHKCIYGRRAQRVVAGGGRAALYIYVDLAQCWDSGRRFEAGRVSVVGNAAGIQLAVGRGMFTGRFLFRFEVAPLHYKRFKAANDL